MSVKGEIQTYTTMFLQVKKEQLRFNHIHSFSSVCIKNCSSNYAKIIIMHQCIIMHACMHAVSPFWQNTPSPAYVISTVCPHALSFIMHTWTNSRKMMQINKKNTRLNQCIFVKPVILNFNFIHNNAKIPCIFTMPFRLWTKCRLPSKIMKKR